MKQISKDLPDTEERTSSKHCFTGEIIPRDYGIITYNEGRKLFVSPSKYAVGTLILERPGQIRARLREKADRDGLDFKELEDAFVKGVVRREGAKNILNISGR